MCSVELDASVCQALRLLHSSSSDSTDQLRAALDELIVAHAGPSRTMANVLPRKYLDREREKERDREREREKDRELERERERDRDEMTLELLEEELTCAVCRHLAIQAGNRLVECDLCHKLYHQECHSPAISEADAEAGWQCFACIDSRDFDTGSGLNSPQLVIATTPTSTTPVGKMSPDKSMPLSPTVKAPFNLLPSPPKVVTPNINIISADRRLQIMKKKAAKQHEIKRKNTK